MNFLPIKTEIQRNSYVLRANELRNMIDVIDELLGARIVTKKVSESVNPDYSTRRGACLDEIIGYESVETNTDKGFRIYKRPKMSLYFNMPLVVDSYMGGMNMAYEHKYRSGGLNENL